MRKKGEAMIFEFVQFYPWPYRKMGLRDTVIGTCSMKITADSLCFHLRGIKVTYDKSNDCMRFLIKAQLFYCPLAHKKIKVPVFEFDNREDKKAFFDYMIKNVKPIILERTGLSKR